MKKILLLIVTLLLAACGGGGGSGSSVTDVNSGTPTGVVAINFVDGSAAAKTVALQTYENVRVVITNPYLRLNGLPFRIVADHAKAEGGFSFALPLGYGYTIEALTYNTNTDGFKVPADYAIATGVSVSNPSNTVSLALNPTAAVMSAPGVVTQGSKFSVMANLSTMGGRYVTPLQNFWYMPTPQRTQYVTFANSTSAFKYSSAHAVSAPIIIGETTAVRLYYQGVFTVKPNLLMGTETAKNWVFYAPSAAFGNLSTAVTAPSNVTIPLPQ